MIPCGLPKGRRKGSEPMSVGAALGWALYGGLPRRMETVVTIGGRRVDPNGVLVGRRPAHFGSGHLVQRSCRGDLLRPRDFPCG